MFKKFLCGVVAAALVLSAAPVLPANTTVASAEAVKVTKTTVGTADYKTKFWAKDGLSEAWKLDDGTTVTIEFENHGDPGEKDLTNKDVDETGNLGIWNNYGMVFCNEPEFSNEDRTKTYQEYGFVRADVWGWGFPEGKQKDNTSLDGKAIEYTNSLAGTDYAAAGSEYRTILKDSNIKLTIVRQGNIALATSVITSIADPSKVLTTSAKMSLGKDKTSTDISTVYVGLVADHACLNIKSVDISKTSGDTQITPPSVSNQKPATTPGPSQKATQKAKFTVKKGKKKVSKVTVKKGKKVTLKVTVIPSKAKLSLVKLTKKQKKIATVTFKKGKLTIKGKKKGNVTVKITSSKQGVYKKTTKSIKVTVKK